jgi:hypothetical protein
VNGGVSLRKFNFILALIFCLTFFRQAGAWVPDTKIDLTLSENCRPEFLEDGLLAKRGNLAAIELFANDYFKRCETQLKFRAGSAWLTMVSMPELEYDFNRPNIKKLEFVDQRDGVVRPGYLGLQPGSRPRPLVVFQCGVLCNLGDASIKSMFIGLFDTGVFHVLALPSSTGSDYQKRNGVMALGGIDEGRQLTRLALMLKERGFPYASKISDIHLVGASLGGHSALYSSLYSDYYEKLHHRKPFDSVMAICPVVRLQESIENITRGSIIGRLFYSNFISQMVDIFDDLPILKSLMPTGRSFRPKYAELREIIANGALDYYKNKTRDPTWGMAPLENARISTVDELWSSNNFVENGYAKKINPLFLWTSSDDPVVKFEDNAEVLIARDKDSRDQKIFNLVMPRGNHCMYEPTYGWQTAGAMMRGYFLSQSPEYTRTRNRSSLNILPARIPYAFRPHFSEARTAIYWKVDAKTKQIYLVSTFRDENCAVGGNVHNGYCFRTSQIPFQNGELNITVAPANRAELLALERRLNTNYRIYGSNGRYLSKNEDPARIEMLNY